MISEKNHEEISSAENLEKDKGNIIFSEETKNAIIIEEKSSLENLDNQDLSQGTRIQNEISDVLILYNSRPQTRELGQKSDDVKLGLELTTDEQSERVNLFLLGFGSIILMNAMAVLIIAAVKVSEYEDQLVIKNSYTKRQMKGNLVFYDSHIYSNITASVRYNHLS